MRKLAGLLAVATLVSGQLLPGAPAIGQTAVSFDVVEVSLWPEYDRPGVLVIYRLTIAPGVVLPAPVAVTIPEAAGLPNAVAQKRGGNLLTLQYDRVVAGDLAEIRFAASEREIQVEYYDPRIARDGDQRQFSYEWPGEYAVRALEFSVQEPAGATGFAVTPPATSSGLAADGLAYHTIQAGSLPAGQTSRVSLQYERQGDALTAETLPPPPAPAAAPPSAGSAAPATDSLVGSQIPMVVGVAVLVLGLSGLVLGLAMRFRGGSGGAPKPASGGRFCTKCGNGLARDDRFCSRCGQAARG